MKGTIIYVGNFELPDKGASANRVVSNGKLFHSLGYRTVYLGVKKDVPFRGIKRIACKEEMYEEAYPQNSKEWLRHMVSIDHITSLMELYNDVCMIILYNAPFSLLLRLKHVMKGKNIKVVYDCTEWTGVTEGSFLKRVVKRMDEHFIRTKIGNVADGLIVISQRMYQAYQASQHVLLLPPLVDLADVIWHQEAFEEQKGYIFCFAGMLDGNKDSLDCIVDAFGRLKEKNVILRIIGVTEQEFCDFYENGEELLQKAKGKIEFMGRRTHQETIKYVLHSDCYIFIRQSDIRNNAGFPTKFSEAFSCGLPIITTDISDIKRYLADRPDSQLLYGISAEEVEKAMKKTLEKQDGHKYMLDRTFHYEEYQKECNAWMEGVLR